MQEKRSALLALGVALLASACSVPSGPPKTEAEREEVMDEFLDTGPMVSGGIPSDDPDAIYP